MKKSNPFNVVTHIDGKRIKEECNVENCTNKGIAIFCISCEVAHTIKGRECENCGSGNWITQAEAERMGI